MNKQTLLTVLTLSLAAFSSAFSANGDFYCDHRELKDSKTKQAVREFEREDECVETLSFSENNKYCESRKLKDLRSGTTIQSFSKSRECDEALFTKISKN